MDFQTHGKVRLLLEFEMAAGMVLAGFHCFSPNIEGVPFVRGHDLRGKVDNDCAAHRLHVSFPHRDGLSVTTNLPRLASNELFIRVLLELHYFVVS